MGIHASVDSHSVLCYEGQRRERLAQHKERIAINTSQGDVSSFLLHLSHEFLSTSAPYNRIDRYMAYSSHTYS